MSNENNKTALPKLRFPEFRGAEGWEETELGANGAFLRGLTYSSENVKDDGLLVVRSSNIQDGNLVLNKDLVFVDINCAPSILLQKGDVAICMANGSKALVGKSAEFDGQYNKPITIGAFCSLFRPLNDFAKLVFKTEEYQNFVAFSIGGGNINNLKNSDLEKFSFFIPAISDEQQKIAATLSSLDDLLTAQSAKLETLKVHRRGLMQGLFPAEGETVPKLRFPEFQGEWVEKKLDEIARRGSGHTPSKSSPEYYNGGIKWVSLADSKRLDNGLITKTAAEISMEGIKNSSAVLHPAGTVLISRDAGIGKSAVMGDSMAVSQHFIVWTCNSDSLNNWFLYHLLQNSKPLFERAAIGSTIKTIGLQFFKDLAFFIPSFAEQQKIADCLTSLDNRITAQSQKIEALKLHKKGLMQSLFPTVKE